MKTVLMNITPQQAEKMLRKNHPDNRRLYPSHVEEFVHLIQSGHFVLTHQGIAFDDAGNLIDGQHRLTAIAKAGKTVPCYVTYGLPKESFFAVDSGKKRGVRDALKVNGRDGTYTNLRVIAGVNCFFRYAVGRHLQLDAVEMEDYITRHKDDMDFICRLANIGRGINATVTAGLLAALYAGEKREALEAFMQAYGNHETDPKYQNKHALDLRSFFDTGKKGQCAETLHRVEGAIFAFIHNRQKNPREEKYPATAICL